MKNKNYLMLNGQQIPFTDDQLEKIKTLLSDREKRLGDIKVGGTFKIGKHEFFVLEHCDDMTAVLYKGLLEDSMKFGKSNNFADDSCIVRERLANFAAEIANSVGADNLIEHEVDLTADDGLDDYGEFHAKMSLLTADQYREYVRIIDKHKLDKWWWLATPHSTLTHENADWVKCVSPRGGIGLNRYGSDGFGVRPFCILNSNIFVSV